MQGGAQDGTSPKHSGISIDERGVLMISHGLNMSAPYSAGCLSLLSTQAKLCGNSPNSITIQKELKHNPCQSFEKHNQIPSMDHRGSQTHRVSRTKSTASETLARAIPHQTMKLRSLTRPSFTYKPTPCYAQSSPSRRSICITRNAQRWVQRLLLNAIIPYELREEL